MEPKLFLTSQLTMTNTPLLLNLDTHPRSKIFWELSNLMLRSGAILIWKSLLQQMSNYESHQGNRMSTVETLKVASGKAAQKVPNSFLCPGMGYWKTPKWVMQPLWIWGISQWIYTMHLSHHRDEHVSDATISSRTSDLMQPTGNYYF